MKRLIPNLLHRARLRQSSLSRSHVPRGNAFRDAPRRAQLLPRILTLAFVLLLLTSCHGQAAPQTPPPTRQPPSTLPSLTPVQSTATTAPTVSPTATSLPEISTPIVWYVRGTAPEDLPQVNNRLNGILADRGFRARVEIRPVEQSAFAKRMAEIQADGEPWDLVSLSGSDYPDWREKGALLPLAEYTNPQTGQVENLLKTDGAGLWSSMPATAWEGLLRSGGIYAVPNQGIWASARGISIRADVVRALNLQPDLDQVHGYADLTPLLAKIQAAIADGALKAGGIAGAEKIRRASGQADLLEPDNAGYDILWGPFVLRFNDPQGKVVNWYQTAEFQELARLRRSWQQAGYLPEEPQTPEQVAEGYQAGTYVVDIGHPVWPGSAVEQRDRFGFTWVDRPIAPAFLSTGELLSSLTGVNVRIGSDPERVRRVMLLVKWLQTDADIYNLLAYGIEGQHWQWADREKQVIAPASNSRYRPDYVAQLGNRTLSYALEAQVAFAWQQTRQDNATVPASAAVGFLFDPRPVAAQAAAVRGLTPELIDPLMNGQAENVERATGNLAKALDEVGLAYIQAEVERQLAAWRLLQ